MNFLRSRLRLTFYQTQLLQDLKTHAESGIPLPSISDPVALVEIYDILQQCNSRLEAVQGELNGRA